MERDSAASYPSYERADQKKPYLPSYAVERSPLIDDGRVVRPNALDRGKHRTTLGEVRDLADAIAGEASAVASHLEELAGALSGVVPDPLSEVERETPPAGIVDATYRRLMALDALIARMSRTASHIRNTIA